MTITQERPVAATGASRPPNGGGPARRAVVRWGVRLFRREWRQQLLVVGLLAFAVAATTAGLAAATNASPSPKTTWVLPGHDSGLATDIRAVEAAFGPAEVFAHARVAVPGSLAALDLRSIEPAGERPQGGLRVRAGRLPTGPGEVAVTSGVATEFGLRLGTTWRDLGGEPLRVVGLVKDPKAYDDQFAVVAPGRLPSTDNVTVQIDSDLSRTQLQSFHIPSGTPGEIEGVSGTTKTQSAVAVLVLATLTLLFVGLVSVASFSVLAHRRQRALGMFGSVGATDSHIRLVMLANGAAVGVVATVVGTTVGLVGWLVLSPPLAQLVAHDVDRFAIPWWAVTTAAVLAVATAVLAAWWPARTASRVPIVVALSGRPPQPPPARRVAALGVVVLAAGMILLAFGRPDRGLLIVTGTIATVVGVLLFGPLAIRTLARLAPRLGVAGRLALRDLARYQSRSGAALGAATLAVGIASIITISSASQIAKDSPSGGNLGTNEMVVYLSPHARDGGPIPELSDSALVAVRHQVDAIAGSVGAHKVVQLDAAVDPATPQMQADGGAVIATPGRSGSSSAGATVGRPAAALAAISSGPNGGESIEFRAGLYVATPEVLAYDGVDASAIDPSADIVSSRNDLAQLKLFTGGRGQSPALRRQHLALPKRTSEPSTLLTPHAVERLGLQAVPAAWLVRTSSPMTAAQLAGARKTAAAAGLTIETRATHHSLVQLANDATAAGIVFALVVLALTVGLIRGEAANDVRILTATGASSTTRRVVTAATAGALALLAAVLGIAEGYLAMAAFYRSDLSTLAHPPIADLLALGVALPLIAALGGFVLAGREPAAIARRPLE